jgi:1-aminocyclopropane-1-carboxylate deaminase
VLYLIPEGGTNSLAIKGCQEILTRKMLNLIIFVAPEQAERFQELSIVFYRTKSFRISGLKGDF